MLGIPDIESPDVAIENAQLETSNVLIALGKDRAIEWLQVANPEWLHQSDFAVTSALGSHLSTDAYAYLKRLCIGEDPNKMQGLLIGGVNFVLGVPVCNIEVVSMAGRSSQCVMSQWTYIASQSLAHAS